jgi:UDP-4-amino-4,6-dideoxy-N-acetyl-beta-L-altrosamine N-acetyltransferase
MNNILDDAKETDQYVLRPMVGGDLAAVLKMRNQYNTRRYMKNSEIISIKEHKDWFEKKQFNADCELLVYLMNRNILGFAQYELKPGSRAVEWGFYKDENSEPGIGLKLGKSVIEHIFTNTAVDSIIGEVIQANLKSVRFHLKLGFVKESVLAKQYCTAGNDFDTVRMILFRPA